LSIDNYNYKNNLNWTSNDTNIKSQELFLLSTYSFHEIVKSVSVRTISEDENGDFSHIVADVAEMGNSVNEQRHRKYGRCYTFYPSSTKQQLGIYYIKLQL
jgi:hypothetical protein